MNRASPGSEGDRWPLTGRDSEMQAIEHALARSGGTMLAGPAGVGKSRLARESLARRAGETPRWEGGVKRTGFSGGWVLPRSDLSLRSSQARARRADGQCASARAPREAGSRRLRQRGFRLEQRNKPQTVSRQQRCRAGPWPLGRERVACDAATNRSRLAPRCSRLSWPPAWPGTNATVLKTAFEQPARVGEKSDRASEAPRRVQNGRSTFRLGGICSRGELERDPDTTRLAALWNLHRAGAHHAMGDERQLP